METLRFLFPDEEKTKSKRTRPNKCPAQMVRPRTWTLHLMHLLGVPVDDLNLQLPLPPTGRPFVLFKEPRPLEKLTKRDRLFQGPLERGTDPAGNYFGFGAGKDRYCLAERVDEHLPGSRAWLLEPLAPYLDADLPPVTVAIQTIAALLSQLKLRRLSADAVEFGAQGHGVLVHRLAETQLDHFSELPSPSFLTLLVALYHERCWADPTSTQAERLRCATKGAFETLMRHPMFSLHPAGKIALQEWERIADFLLWKIRRYGQRSPAPESMPRLSRSLPSLFCSEFVDFSDADYCAALGFATPIRHFLWPRLTRFSDNEHPSEAESTKAFLALVNHAAIGNMALPPVPEERPELKHFLQRFGC